MNRRPFRPTVTQTPSIDPEDLQRLRQDAQLLHRLTAIVGTVTLRDRTGAVFYDGPSTREALRPALAAQYAREDAQSRARAR
jgi:hypothetical protein